METHDHTALTAASTDATRRQAYLSIFENSPDCVKIIGVDGSLLAMNVNGQCAMEIDDFGAVCGEMWPSLWPEASRQQVHDALSNARTGSIGHFEAFCPTAKGTPKWWDVVVSPLLGSDGSLQGLLSISRDITRRREADERERKLMNQQAADHDRMWRLSTDLMLVADFNSEIVSVNPAWTTILGYETRAIIGRNFMTLVHPDDQAATSNEVGRLASGLTTLRFENRYRHADGSWRDISWTAVPDVDLIHAVGRDITDEKRAAEALRETESALLQAQKLESIGKLTGGVAHDFNNVLQIISGNLQLLQLSAGANEATMKRLTTASIAVERGARLASQLLSFARRHPLKPVVADLRELLGAMDDLLQRAIGESVAVELAVDNGLWHTLIDPNQLENVLLNLAINARDAMNGQGKLTIELRNAELDAAYCAGHPEVCAGQYVMLAVSDTGCGIPSDLADKIFEPFFTTKREGEGTGLGLSMAYGFIKQSGGHIKVYSEVGHGTTFKLYLPRSMAELESLPEALNGPVVGGNETVLVVEDDLQVQETVVEILKGLGYTVLKAADGQSALSIIDSGLPIDLLFTDVVMPGELRSPELARRAKAILPGLEILFTSGYTQNAIVHGGRLDAGV
jgi:PAS domain S-box-containing protein